MGGKGHRLEPEGRKVLHGAGQSPEEFAAYREALDRKPLLYMDYCGLRSRPERIEERLARELSRYPGALIPQIGLSMTTDGTPEDHYEAAVAEGHWDATLDDFCRALGRLGRPAFLRIGYEFNGHWNGYAPATYAAAFRRVVEALRRHRLEEVAAVWCFAPEGRDADFMAYYPGDAYVDWWSFDPFDVEHFTAPATEAFLAEAQRRGFPVLIGESTPRRVGVHGGRSSWDTWFKPYFDCIRRHACIKGFCYISWDWSHYPMWKDWGDGRIAANAEVLESYRDALSDPMFLHAGEWPAIRAALGLPGQAATPGASGP